MVSYRDWVVETSSTTGTGTYNLSGSAPAGTSYFTFRQRFSNGEDEIVYWVVNADRTKWEKNQFGTLTYGTTDTLTRNVIESTNGDAPVSWVGGDLPLKLYVVQDADAAEFAIGMGLGATKPDVLKYGQWADEDGLAADFDQIKHFDGTSDDIIGVVNRIAHKATIYGLPPGHLYGLTLSRSSATAIGIDAGAAMNSTNVVGIHLASAITKSTAGSWATGTGQNGMADTVTIGNNTWYHVFAGLADGVADAFIDSSVSAANAPSEFTHFRRIGSFRTNASAQIIAFTQIGDKFLWTVPVNDYSATSTGATITLTVPTGVKVEAHVRILGSVGSPGTRNIIVHSPDQTAMTPNTPAGNITISWGAADVQAAGEAHVMTNTSAQVVLAANNTTILALATDGWTDRRGKDG